MMCGGDFDLSQALDSSYCPDGEEFGKKGKGCYRAVMEADESENISCRFLRLEVGAPRSMRQMANFVVALGRMKNGRKPRSTEFTDRELLNVLFENVIEENVVMEVQRTSSEKVDYECVRSNVECRVFSQQRPLVRCKKDEKLYAMSPQYVTGEFIERAVRLSLLEYKKRTDLPTNLPVALGITGTNIFLYCEEDSKKVPRLYLKKVEDRTALREISSKNGNFLFYKIGSGCSSTKFESVKFSGWHISVGWGDEAPVDMCTSPTTDRCTAFQVLQ